MDQDMITDITLDHLPDLSDASVSFQIPYNNTSADLLLAGHADGFDVLCNAVDNDASFAPVVLTHPRGPLVTLDEPTPRVQRVQGTPRPPHRSPSPTPTQVPTSLAKPSIIQRPLTLGHRSPDKSRKTPSCPKSIHRQLESPLVSSERFYQLRAEVESLGQADESPSHPQMHVMKSVENGSVGCSSSSHINSKTKNNGLDILPASEDLLDPIPEEKDTSKDVEPPADQDVVVATGDSCPADTMNLAVPAPRPKSKRNPRTSTKPTVAAGGISKRTAFPTTHVSKKTKDKASRVREAHPVPPSAARLHTLPQSIDAEKELVPPACTSGDIDYRPESTQITHPSTGKLAERLVSYSQRLISSIGLYKPLPENSFIEASDDAVRAADARVETQPSAAVIPPSLPLQCINDISGTHSEPFRLSEISPHKQPPNSSHRNSPENTGVLQDGGLHAMSPPRPGKKRVGVDADQSQEYHRCQRGKTMLADADSERGSSNEAVSHSQPRPTKKTRVHEDQSITHPEIRDNTQHPDPSKSTLPSARTKYRPKFTSSQCKGPTLNAFPYLSSSRQVYERTNKDKSRRDEWRSKAARVQSKSLLNRFSASSRLRHDMRAIQENAIESSHTRQRSGPTSAADLPLIEKKPNATLSVAQVTKPVGFTFRVDARLEARKAEGERLAVSEPGKMHPLHTVPDVKAYRASHHAAFTLHKEGVIPSVPVVPFFFCTEQRAKEREKFDEMVKRKEEEMQRLKEEQLRREAEEEERAIKELRRKAIPKANEIPEWYADMPKRKGTAVEGGHGKLTMA